MASGGAAAGSTSTSTPAVESGDLIVEPADFVLEDQPLAPIEEGGLLSLRFPPQGGHVLQVGAYIKGLATDTIELKARLRTVGDDHIIAEEGRTVVVVPIADRPGWSQPNIETRSQVAHIPVCPDYLDVDMVGVPMVLELQVRELYVDPPREARGRRTVTLTCDGPEVADKNRCLCECAANYTLGKCGPVTK